MFHVKSNLAEATRLTRLGRLAEATALLRGEIRPTASEATPSDAQANGACLDMQPPQTKGGVWTVASGRKDHTAHPKDTDAAAAGARFEDHMFSNACGSRSYKLYVPSMYTGQALPLIVMLHGCTQSPDDFAAGTRMNELAEEQGFLVAYPAQSKSANISKCWNWFNTADQQRDRGEAGLIAGITQQIMQTHRVDDQRVYAAGLSAGGASAAIMGAVYPDLFAAIGVHSGLACGAARDMPSAFAAMRQGSSSALPVHGKRNVPTIVFHGDGDTTVAAVNGEQVIAQASAGMALTVSEIFGKSEGGATYRRSIHADEHGLPVFEKWMLQGAGHAWAGGSPKGSYTDPAGPDASREMARFFMLHRLSSH